MIRLGIYRHYKGGMYDVLGVAKHSETQEEFVVYRARYGERELWVRPLVMFCESLTNGAEQERVSRFEYIGP